MKKLRQPKTDPKTGGHICIEIARTMKAYEGGLTLNRVEVHTLRKILDRITSGPYPRQLVRTADCFRKKIQRTLEVLP